MKTSDRRKLETLYNALVGVANGMGDTMPIRQAIALLSVAIREQQEGAADLRDVMADTGASSPVASRDLLILSKKGRSKKGGLDLIKTREDYTDLRLRKYVLTPKGNALIDSILEGL